MTFQPRPTRARQVKLPRAMPRPRTLPAPGTVRVWLVPHRHAMPVNLGTHPGRHPGAVVAALPYPAFAFIVLTPSGRHTAWTRPATNSPSRKGGDGLPGPTLARSEAA